MDGDGRGRVILLNGPSSSGKSTLARALLEVLPGPWFHVPVDAVGAMRSTPPEPLPDDQVAEVLRRTRLGYHRVVAGLAAAGNDVVMDYPLSERWRLDDLLRVLDGYDVLLVEVRCSPAELSRRELARGDRPPGLAVSQLEAIAAIGDRDLVVDSTDTPARAAAEAVADAVTTPAASRAFDRLRAARG